MSTDSQRTTPIEYSVVVPVYNGAASLPELCSRISAVFAELGLGYEIVLVDDASADESWQVMQKLHEDDPRVKVLHLMRNFGQHNALMCGFHHAAGDFIITMDDDLQNQPEDIPRLIEEIGKGYDVVIGALDSKKDSYPKNLASLFIRNLIRVIFGMPKEVKLSSLKIMTRSITEEIKTLRTPYPYISGMLFTLTRNVVNVPVRHEERKYGRSTYTMKKLFLLAFNLIINYTSLPLRLLTSVGIAVSLLSFFMGLYFILKKVMMDYILPGWTSVVVLLAFFNGLLLAILSIIGEYLARIIGEVSNKPQYVVREKRL